MLQSVRHAHSAKRVAMTPLIDIVFILLLFFILQSNFTQFRELLLPVPAKFWVPAIASRSAARAFLRVSSVAGTLERSPRAAAIAGSAATFSIAA